MPYRYDVSFDFSTVHRGSKFVGRSAKTEIASPRPLSEVDKGNEGLKSALAQSILASKPTYKIFTLFITDIKPLPEKKEVTK